MKATKTLLAAAVASALAIAASADAATIATYNVVITGNITQPVTGNVTGSGTAFLDDSGLLTINTTATSVNTSSGSQTYTAQNLYYGTISGTIFTVTSGTVENLACISSNATTAANPGQPTVIGAGCSANLLLGTVQALGPSVAGTVTGTVGQPGGLPLAPLANYVVGGNLVGITRGIATTRTTLALTATTPVPVPAAAWLFGSGLLGLAGTARRRRGNAA